MQLYPVLTIKVYYFQNSSHQVLIKQHNFFGINSTPFEYKLFLNSLLYWFTSSVGIQLWSAIICSKQECSRDVLCLNIRWVLRSHCEPISRTRSILMRNFPVIKELKKLNWYKNKGWYNFYTMVNQLINLIQWILL